VKEHFNPTTQGLLQEARMSLSAKICVICFFYTISDLFIFLIANNSFVTLSLHNLTSPKAPLPIIANGSKSLAFIFFRLVLYKMASLCIISYLTPSFS
jgi:hypothetical protein